MRGWLLFLCTLLTVAAFAAPDAPTHLGNAVFHMPPGWTVAEQDGITYLVPPDVPEGKSAALAVVPGQTLEGELRAWFDARWQEIQGEAAVVEGGEVRSAVAAGGYPFLYTAAKLQDKDKHTWAAFLVVAQPGDQVQPFMYITDDDALFAKHQDALGTFFGSLSFANLAPAATPQTPATPAAVGAIDDALSPSFTWGTIPRPTGNAGLSGAYHRVGIETEVDLYTGDRATSVKHQYWCFFPDGRAIDYLPDEGLENFNWDQAIKGRPLMAYTYQLTGNVGLLTPVKDPAHTQALKRVNGRLIIGPNEDVYALLDSCDGLTLQGTYRRFDWQEEYSPKEGLTFTKDGHFTDEGFIHGVVYQWWYVDHNDWEISSQPGTGTYRLTNNSLELIYADGRKRRVSFHLDTGITREDVKSVIINSWSYRRLP